MTTSQDELKAAAFKVGKMLSEFGDFYDVVEGLSAGYAEGLGAEAGGVRSILVQLGALDSLQASANTVMSWRVDDARAALVSWSEIGDVLDVSKQAAQQKYGSK